MTTKNISWACVIAFFVWLAIGLLPLAFKSCKSPGEIGDMFGMVNSLFSGFALAGVICAILMQREELSLQRKELELTRNELARSAQAQSESAKALTQQYSVAEKTARLHALSALLQSANEEMKLLSGDSSGKISAAKQLHMESFSNLEARISDLEMEIRELLRF